MMVDKRPQDGHGEALSAYIDGELTREEAETLVAHMDACPECRRALESLKRAKAVLRSMPHEELPPHRARVIPYVAQNAKYFIAVQAAAALLILGVSIGGGYYYMQRLHSAQDAKTEETASKLAVSAPAGQETTAPGAAPAADTAGSADSIAARNREYAGAKQESLLGTKWKRIAARDVEDLILSCRGDKYVAAKVTTIEASDAAARRKVLDLVNGSRPIMSGAAGFVVDMEPIYKLVIRTRDGSSMSFSSPFGGPMKEMNGHRGTPPMLVKGLGPPMTVENEPLARYLYDWVRKP